MDSTLPGMIRTKNFLVPKHQMNESVTESIMTEFIEWGRIALSIFILETPTALWLNLNSGLSEIYLFWLKLGT